METKDMHQAKATLTICIASFNSYEFIFSSIYAIERLTVSNWQLFICDSGSDFQNLHKLRVLVSRYTNIHLYVRHQSKFGSIGHGESLNYLASLIDTSYFAILDADCIPLMHGWDQFCLQKLSEGFHLCGTPVASNSPGNSPRDRNFPTIFLCFGFTHHLKSLNIDFRPRDISNGEDTGWMLKQVYTDNHLLAYPLFGLNTRSSNSQIFGSLVCDEYFTNPFESILICSHFGRGSNPSSGKYKSYFNKKRKFFHEKSSWLALCMRYVQAQSEVIVNIGPHLSVSESNCWNCGSKSFEPVLYSRDRYTSCPGIWELVRCTFCSSTRTLFQIDSSVLRDLHDASYPCFRTDSYHNVQRSSPLFVRFVHYFNQVFRNILLASYFNYRHLSKFRLSKLFSPLFSIILDSYYQMLIPYYSYLKSPKLLEVGAGDGDFLYWLKKLGWNVTGIELSADASQRSDQLDYPITNIPFDNIYFPSGSFQCIIMRMVLESIHCPRSALNKANSLLSKDGQLLLSVHNFDGYESKLFRAYSNTLQMPIHMTHFTFNSLSFLLGDCGFELEKVVYDSFYRDIRAGIQNYIYDHPYSFAKYFLKLPVPLFKLVSFVAARFGLTSRIYLYCRKVRNNQ